MTERSDITRTFTGEVYRHEEIRLSNGSRIGYFCIAGQVDTTVVGPDRRKLMQYCHTPVLGWRRWLESGRYLRGWRCLPRNQAELQDALEALMIADERNIAGKLLAEIAFYGFPR